MCFVFIVVSVVFVVKTMWFCGFPTSTAGSMKVVCFNVVHIIEI
jgi:hypothetical protein